MRLGLFFMLALLLAGISCEDDPFDAVPSKGMLEFSKDTIFLDTVFTNISSSTRNFKVYNLSNENIRIPSIKLGRGEDSYYRLNVDGNAGKSFENVDILARDSIYVFVEATIDFETLNGPLYTDQILFEGTESEQKIELVTLVQDAHFLYPSRDAQGIKETIPVGKDEDGNEIRVEGFYLNGNQVWTNDKPYVIYGYAAVAPGNRLEIEKGTSVFFHKASGLLIEKGAFLKVSGTRDEKVSFQGDRLEEFFKEVPGQWGTIWLKPGSKTGEIKHALIRNGTIGILIDSVGHGADQALRLSETEIYNTSSFGLFARSSNLEGANLVIGNNGESSLACIGGGSYLFAHSTIANYWSRGIRNLPAVWFTNREAYTVSEELQDAPGDLRAQVRNCIIEGNRSIEFILEQEEGSSFDFSFENSLLRFNDLNGSFAGDPLYDFENTDLYLDNLFNGEPDFKDIGSNDMRIGQGSGAIGLGNRQAASSYPIDLLGRDRTASPDSGAYQHQVFEEE